MFSNGSTAMDGRVIASALTASETTSSSREISGVNGSTRRTTFRAAGVARYELDRVGVRAFFDISHEATMQSLDELLFGAAVAEHAPGAVDAARKGGF